MEETQIVEIWDLFVEHIPEKHRETLALQYIEYLLDSGFDVDDLDAITGHDDYLDNAVEEVTENLQEDDEFEEDE